jgi:senataxin
VLGSVLKNGKEYGSPGWCTVQLSSAIPEGPLFLVFLINMKTYNRIWRCLFLGKNHANLDELQNSGPVNKVWQFNPRVCWPYAHKVSNIPCLFDTSIFLISAFILGLEF